MREDLYLKLDKFSFRYDYFMYYDTLPYLADQCFIRNKVEVRFDSEWEQKGNPYVAILCHVRKRDVPSFLKALEDLKRSMLICGHPSYEQDVSDLLDALHKAHEEMYQEKHKLKAET